YEFDGFQPVAMAGGTAAHETIKVNLLIALGSRLRGKPCRPYGSDLKVRIGDKIRYPDAFVVCTPVSRRDTVVADPVVIFEVLSTSTALTDRIVKNREYQTLPSVRRYVMIEQDSVAATVFERSGDDWVGHVLPEDAILRMPEIGIDIPLRELYDGIDMTTADEQAPDDGAPEAPR
ncbi:MAG TPA: Uma2 family endonuclease, partial [Acetobacteraceae bacterium]|nr:Uma2 family endonuclease [Acetobacteraceae bacterium]